MVREDDRDDEVVTSSKLDEIKQSNEPQPKTGPS